MNKLVTILLVLVLSLVDLSVNTVLYCHGNKFKASFSVAISLYSFTTSVFELWCIGCLRISVIIGLVIGVLANRESSPARINLFQQVSVYCVSLTCMFAIVKLLCVSEDSQLLHNPWFWGLFSWTWVGSVLFVVHWKLLGKITPAELVIVNVNCDDSEAKPLLGSKQETGSSTCGKKESDKAGSQWRKGTIRRLVALSRPDWLLVLIGFVFLAASSAGEIFVPFYTGRVVDGIVIDRSQKEFTDAIIVMALISAGSSIAAGIRGGCFFVAIRRLNIRVRNLLFSSILKQEIGFFDNVQSGELTSRLTSDTTTMSDALGLNMNIFLRNLIKGVGVVIFMVKLSWRLTMVTVIGLPCILTVSRIYGKYYKKLAEQVQDSLAEANSVAEEACSTMRTVRSFANEHGEATRYANKLHHTFKLNKKQAVMYSGFVWCSNLFELALTVAVLYYGGQLVLQGVITGGRLISFILYQIQLGSCVNDMGSVYTGLMEAAGASEKVFDYIDRKPRLAPSGTVAPDSVNGQVEFRNVTFNYPSRPDVPVLRDLSFIVKPGEVVALVGPSGGGKTSCVNLLQYFYAADSGQVLLDNVPVQKYDHHFLHKEMSLVGQEPILYARSVEENICYGLEESEWSRAAVETAATLANAHSFVSQLKDGYDTQTGEKGIQMSGGQKQRIAIARALIRKPKLLLLDEATSALDSESEFLVQQALYQNLSGRTVIIIAHRLSTVERADRIIVIDKGTVVEQGTHQQLLERKGMYTSLVKRQLLDSENSYNDLRLSQMGECSCSRRRRVSGGRHPSGHSLAIQHGNGYSQAVQEEGQALPRATFIVGSA